MVNEAFHQRCVSSGMEPICALSRHFVGILVGIQTRTTSYFVARPAPTFRKMPKPMNFLRCLCAFRSSNPNRRA